MTEGPFTGSCLCGAVRYSAARLGDPGWCHCRQCQRASGAPAVVWADCTKPEFTVKGPVARIKSSNHTHRLFCLYCGSTLFMVEDATDGLVNIAVATLDEPARIRPEFHIWDSARLPWFDPPDQLPRHAEER
ncbi:MAG: GFA family protein [Aliidongia sp.]